MSDMSALHSVFVHAFPGFCSLLQAGHSIALVRLRQAVLKLFWPRVGSTYKIEELRRTDKTLNRTITRLMDAVVRQT